MQPVKSTRGIICYWIYSYISLVSSFLIWSITACNDSAWYAESVSFLRTFESDELAM